MMLVQKQPQFSLNLAATAHHRKHPSAPPAVLVQSTRTPGLLSITKPARPQPVRQPLDVHSNKHSRAKHTQQHSSPKPKQAHAQPVDDASKAAISEKRPRGRQQNKTPKDKQQASRSSSQGAQTKRPHGRQPSPPKESSLEAAPTTPTRSSVTPFSLVNTFDPFVSDSETSDSGKQHDEPVLQTPKLSSKPSGKLARRRQPASTAQVPASPSPAPKVATKALPVPGPRSSERHAIAADATSGLSRSDPVPSHMPAGRPLPKRASTVSWHGDGFPVCDDSMSPPITPRRHPVSLGAALADGPRTAPLSLMMASAPPFFTNVSPARATSPTPASRRPRHARVPSGVFEMEDVSLPGDKTPTDELKALFGLIGSNQTTPKRDSPANKKDGFFASSIFQNSPSPDALPPPAF